MKNICLSMLVVLSLATGVSADAPWISITGTVVSVTGDVLVLRTANGDLRFDIDKDTERPANLPVGNRMTVWYDSDDKPEDKMDARRIEMAPAMTTPAPTPTPTPTPYVRPEVTQEPVTRTAVDQERNELPRTASFLPLVGGIGLASLACGAVLQRIARRK
ncbi:MAG: hypothetical protein ACKVU1_10400 [bacterium]